MINKMNDSRFKELVNLYLDQRLSSADAKELEHALEADPARRSELRSYTVMQRGCAELFRRSAEDAPSHDGLLRALRAAEARMNAKPPRRSALAGFGIWGVTAGAAVMVVLVVARISQPTSSGYGGARLALGASGESSLPLRSIANAESLFNSAGRASPSGTSQAQLTLAALGISPEQQSSSGLSRWDVPDEGLARLDGSQSYPTWAQASAALEAEWASMAASEAQFNSRPINAWAGHPHGGTSPYQPVSFTIGR